MQIICADGTRFQCTDFETTDSGVLVFDETMAEAEEKADPDSPIGFIPITELQYVLPDQIQPQAQPRGGMQPGQVGGVTGQPQQTQPGQQPPGRGQQRMGQQQPQGRSQ